nr:hypothetical protein [Tanacetum cinerariifolium]
MYGFKECPSCGALYNKSCGCSKGSFVDKFVRDPNKTPDSSQQSPRDCLKCGNPVDCLYCRQCAILRKKLKEVWFTICDEHEFLQDFLNTPESSNDNTNIVSASQEPFIFNQDPGENSSQSPPHIDQHCCYGCGDPLDGIFCRRCTCESCGNGAHIGYNCPPKVPVISNLEPCHNQNVDELPQTLTSLHPTCYSGDENLFAHDSTPNFVNDSPSVSTHPHNPQRILMSFVVLLLAWDRVSEIKNAFGNKQYKLEDVQELIRKLLNDVQNIHEELAEYINTPSWNRLAFSNYDDDDDEDYTIAITPEEPDNSLSMGDEHLDTISATESDENFSDSNDDSTLIDDDYYSIDNINYVEASPPDFELVSLEEVEYDNLREKLLNINLLIAKIESLNDNPTPDRVLKSPSPFPIPVKDSDSFLEKSDTSLSYSDKSLSEFKTFSDHTEETSSDSTTTHADYALPKYDSFLFEIEPDQGELTSVVMEDYLREPRVHVPNVLPTHPTLMLDSDFIPSDNSLPESEIFYFDIEEKNSGSTTIYADISLTDLECFNFKSEPDPGELTSIFYSGIPENILPATNVNLSPEDQSPLFAYVGVSHRSGTFMKFNDYPNHLNESSMEILSSTCSSMDQ